MVGKLDQVRCAARHRRRCLGGACAAAPRLGLEEAPLPTGEPRFRQIAIWANCLTLSATSTRIRHSLPQSDLWYRPHQVPQDMLWPFRTSRGNGMIFRVFPPP